MIRLSTVISGMTRLFCEGLDNLCWEGATATLVGDDCACWVADMMVKGDEGRFEHAIVSAPSTFGTN